MTEDHKNLSRTAQRCIAEVRRVADGGAAEPIWQPMYEAQVISVTHTAGPNFNTAQIRFPTFRWDEKPYGLNKGDLVRIRTASDLYPAQTILFEGIYTRHNPSFSGGAGSGGAFERNEIECADYRWLLHVTSPLYGQFARGVDDYTDFGAAAQAAINDSVTFMSGCRCIFNPGGKPNRDPEPLYLTGIGSFPVFAPPRAAYADGSESEFWTARQMLQYIFMPALNGAYTTLAVNPLSDLIGISHADFDSVLNGVTVDGLSIIEAADLICRHLGWTFRQQDSAAGPLLVFYKIGTAWAQTGYTLLHDLHAPAANEDIADAVADGLFLCSDAEIIEDISAVVNNPLGLGAPQRFEFTAELISAWEDSDLVPDTDNLFFSEAQLLAMATPDTYSFYNKYHTRGAAFLRDVGRKWALNETGKYTNAATYNRGPWFDFATVIPDDVRDAAGKRLFGPFARTFLPPLTFDKEDLSSVGVKVEFSFDGGVTWKTIDCVIDNLPGEAGIRIAEPNLSNIKLPGEAKISGGTLDGKDLNYWTSLCADVIDGEDYTRVRVTASVRMDQRLRYVAPKSGNISSPYTHRRIFDFSDRYTYQRRMDASLYSTSDLPAWQTDQTADLAASLDQIRAAMEDLSISGRFTLERLWLGGDDDDRPAFLPGDGIRQLTGRNYRLYAVSNGGLVYPEIVQVHYDIEHQKMHLLTRDLRLEEVRS